MVYWVAHKVSPITLLLDITVGIHANQTSISITIYIAIMDKYTSITGYKKFSSFKFTPF